MGMKDSMDKWTKTVNPQASTEEVRKTCQNLGVTGDDFDSCILLATTFDNDEIDETEFLTGLGELLKKSPEEVHELLRTTMTPSANKQQAPSIVAQKDPEGERIANVLKVRFDGIQKFKDERWFVFTDVDDTGGTILAHNEEEARQKLDSFRTEFFKNHKAGKRYLYGIYLGEEFDQALVNMTRTTHSRANIYQVPFYIVIPQMVPDEPMTYYIPKNPDDPKWKDLLGKLDAQRRMG